MVVREMNIAVVDDKSKDREEVIQHIMKYKKLNHLDFHIRSAIPCAAVSIKRY